MAGPAVGLVGVLAFTDALLRLEGAAAAAAGDDVRVVHGEARPGEPVHVVHRGAAEVRQGERIDKDLNAVLLDDRVALLRSGAVPVGEFALYGASDVGADGVTGSVTLDPVPLCAGEPFTGTLKLHSARARKLQEIRVEIRVEVKATVASGLTETIVAWWGVIGAESLEGDRSIAIEGRLDERALPSIELPHGRTAATFHVILATAWAPDPHLVRDVAIATTLAL